MTQVTTKSSPVLADYRAKLDAIIDDLKGIQLKPHTPYPQEIVSAHLDDQDRATLADGLIGAIQSEVERLELAQWRIGEAFFWIDRLDLWQHVYETFGLVVGRTGGSINDLYDSARAAGINPPFGRAKSTVASYKQIFADWQKPLEKTAPLADNMIIGLMTNTNAARSVSKLITDKNRQAWADFISRDDLNENEKRAIAKAAKTLGNAHVTPAQVMAEVDPRDIPAPVRLPNVHDPQDTFVRLRAKATDEDLTELHDIIHEELDLD